MKLLDLQIYIYNIYNLVNIEKTNTNIYILKIDIVVNLYKKDITLRNFN